MIPSILAVLGLFVVQSLLGTTIRYVADKTPVWQRLMNALGPRDDPPPMPVLGDRANRAMRNLQEAMPVFLALALLNQMSGEISATAVYGAWIFLALRVVYIPAFLAGIAGIRTAVWMSSWIGLVMMAVPLVTSLMQG